MEKSGNAWKKGLLFVQLYFHDNALRGRSLNHRLGLVSEVIIHGFP